jgi:hypothetical protein
MNQCKLIFSRLVDDIWGRMHRRIHSFLHFAHVMQGIHNNINSYYAYVIASKPTNNILVAGKLLSRYQTISKYQITEIIQLISKGVFCDV